MQISDRTFLITGGASGLGAACARQLATAGGNIVVADLNETVGQELVSSLGPRARFARCDVTDGASVLAAIDVAVGQFGGLHGAINCAGISHVGRVLAKE